MLIGDCTVSTTPILSTKDSIILALQYMNDYGVSHLPVQDGEIYLGLLPISIVHELPNEELENPIGTLQSNYILASINKTDHLLKAIHLIANLNLTLLPVLDENAKLVGSLIQADVLKYTNQFLGNNNNGALIMLELENYEYSLGEINKLVETNDAQILQFNSFLDAETGLMYVTLRINKQEVSAILASFQRYDYHVKYYKGEEFYDNELKNNYKNLISYLNI